MKKAAFVTTGSPRDKVDARIAAPCCGGRHAAHALKEIAGEDHDHPHHRSLWFAHSDVNGIDFWNHDNAGSPRPKGKIVHEALVETTSGAVGVLRTHNRWAAPDGKVFCTDDTTIRSSASGDEHTMDFEVTLRAPANAPVLLNDNKEPAHDSRRRFPQAALPRAPAWRRRKTSKAPEKHANYAAEK